MRSATSIATENKKPVNEVMEESDVQVTFRTYINYIFYSKKNRATFWICILFFFMTEGFNTAYFRILANYDSMVKG